MKKITWLYFIIGIVLITSCTNDKEKPSRTFISVAQILLDTIINDSKLSVELDSGTVKSLWDYDERLYKSSSKSKKFIVSRKINPCCPCSSSEPTCCMCLIETGFASLAEMGASVKLDGRDTKTNSSIDGVDVFTIPEDTPNGKHTLEISTKIIRPVVYSVDIKDGRMEF